MSDKPELRQKGRRARKSLTNAERTQASLDICDLLLSTPLFRRASTIGCYLASDEEVDTWPLIERAWRMKKRIFVPVIEENARMKFMQLNPGQALVTNRFGLAEPSGAVTLSPKRLDIAITPLVAFDFEGNRIGMGGGYYDRAFAFLNHRLLYRKPKLIGLAFANQEVERIGASPWDIPLFQVYTERGAVLDQG
jgi:5-formyltetrahydrofolate cyclo-ligase